MIAYSPRARSLLEQSLRPAKTKQSKGKAKAATARPTAVMKKGGRAAGLQVLPTLSRPMLGKSEIMTGTDYLGNVSVAASPTTAKQSILAILPVTPSEYAGTRLTQMAGLWERYRFHKFTVRYVPSVPNTLGCQLICYLDTDPLDDATTITDFDQLVRQATAQAGARQWNFNSPRSIDLAMRADDQLYYTGIDRQNERFSRQGTLYVVQVTKPVGFSGSALTEDITAGSLYVDWKCEFQIPQIEPPTGGILPTFSVEKQTLFTADKPLQVGALTQDLGTFDVQSPYLQMLEIETGIRVGSELTVSTATGITLQLLKPDGKVVEVSKTGVVYDQLEPTYKTQSFSDLLFEGSSTDTEHFLIGEDAPYGQWTVQVKPDVPSSRPSQLKVSVYGYRLIPTTPATGKIRFFLRGQKKPSTCLSKLIVPWSKPETRPHILY
jgi:hypothetical protein